MKLRTYAWLGLSVSLFSFVVPAFAGTQANITIEQLSPTSYGTWSLLSEDGSSRTSKDKGVDTTGGFTMGLTEFGQTTLSVTTPPGMSAIIAVYHGGELVKEETSQQFSFPIHANDKYRFLIKYSMSRVGSLGVTSEPSGLRFRLKGPSGHYFTAKTPTTVKDLPSGRYSLYFPATETCIQPAVQTIDVQPEQRKTAKVTLMCNIETKDTVDTSRISKRTLREYVQKRETKTRGDRK